MNAIAYAHADIEAARDLHRRLERFRIDRDLIGRDVAGFDRVPATLRPIFRDREDFAGGHGLTDAMIAALDASAALVIFVLAGGGNAPCRQRGSPPVPLAPRRPRSLMFNALHVH